ncbi:MAG: GTP-binding protein, partial [Candidatus Aenigmatarchaeota archaeon]
ERKQQLAAQMKFRLEKGNGVAVYIIGIRENGEPKGLSELEFEETLNILRIISRENNARIEKVEKFLENGKIIGRIIIKQVFKIEKKENLIVGVAGHVAHGKSTLIATIITGEPDKDGRKWLQLNVLPHEIERGLSADLHFTLFGFKNSSPIYLKNPLDKKERAKVFENSDKVISFVDTVGHEPWLRTTIRGLVGQNLDYGLLVVAADDGVTHITKEHLGILLALELPIIVCITKIDKVTEKRREDVKEEVENLIKLVGRIPFMIKDEKDLSMIVDKIETIVPIFDVSSRTFEGINYLIKFLNLLPKRKIESEKPFLMFIDRIYKIQGVGTVVSGTIKQGRIKAGSTLLIGPFGSGDFKKVKTASIQTHYYPLEEADAGLIVGICLKGVKHEDLRRGLVLCDPSFSPKAVKSFEAEILVLTHPTRIASGYEPVVHFFTASQSAKLECIDKKYLKSGESGKVKFTFKYFPCFIQEGDKFVFREGKTKGIGTVTRIINP